MDYIEIILFDWLCKGTSLVMILYTIIRRLYVRSCPTGSVYTKMLGAVFTSESPATAGDSTVEGDTLVNAPHLPSRIMWRGYKDGQQNQHYFSESVMVDLEHRDDDHLVTMYPLAGAILVWCVDVCQDHTRIAQTGTIAPPAKSSW